MVPLGTIFFARLQLTGEAGFLLTPVKFPPGTFLYRGHLY
jgi:hypothetical protein